MFSPYSCLFLFRYQVKSVALYYMKIFTNSKNMAGGIQDRNVFPRLITCIYNFQLISKPHNCVYFNQYLSLLHAFYSLMPSPSDNSNFLSILNFYSTLRMFLVYSKVRFYFINWIIWVYLIYFKYTQKIWVYLKIWVYSK